MEMLSVYIGFVYISDTSVHSPFFRVSETASVLAELHQFVNILQMTAD